MGTAPLSPPIHTEEETNINSLTRWRLVSKLQRDFWKIWSTEYLSRLQQRPKWRTKQENIEPGQLVLIKDENIPATRWLLARVTETHPGKDGLTRVASLRCKGNVILKRPITKLCKLPIENEQGCIETPAATKICTNVTTASVQTSPTQETTQASSRKRKSTDIETNNKKRKMEKRYEQAEMEACPDTASKFNKQLHQFRLEHMQRKRKGVRIFPVAGYKTLVPIEKQLQAVKAYEKRYKTELPKLAKLYYSERYRRSTNHGGGWTAIHPTILYLLLILFAKVGRCSYNITQPKAGLYIEHIGEANLKRGTLRVELSYPLNVTSDEDRIHKTLSQMEEVCNRSRHLSSDIHCDLLLQHLKERGRTISHEMALLNDLEVKRKRRNIFGNILEYVFGVNEDVYTDINTLRQNQQILQQAAQHQSSLMLSTIAVVNDTEARVTQKINIFTSKLNKALEEINKVQGWFSQTDTNRININIIAAYQLAINFLDDLEDHYIRLAMNRGSLLEFISPAKIANITIKTSDQLPSNLKISGTPEDKLELIRDDENIILYGYLPIMERDQYTLMKATAIPFNIKNNTYIAPDISRSIIGTNYNTQTYFELTETELATCITQTKHLMLCTPTVVSSIETNPNCIIDEIYHRQERQPCSLKQFSVSTTLWKHLYMANTWLFISNSPTTAAVKCNGVREDIILDKIGIIQINNNCLIQTKKNILTSTISAKIPVKSTFNKAMNFNINTTIMARTTHREPIEREPILKSSDHLFDAIRDQEVLQQDTTSSSTILKTIGHHTASAISAIIITILLIVLAYKLRRQVCNYGFSTRRTVGDTNDIKIAQKTPQPSKRANLPQDPRSSRFILNLPPNDHIVTAVTRGENVQVNRNYKINEDDNTIYATLNK